jgi:hypothetical protein
LKLTGDLDSPILWPVRGASTHGLPQFFSFLSHVELNEITPIRGPRDWPLTKGNQGRAPRALGQAAPRPVLCTRDKTRPECVALNVATESQKVRVTGHRKGFVPPLIDVARAGRPSICVPSFAVGRGQPRHERRQFAVSSRPQDQMEVVWHEAVRQTPHGDSLLGLAKHLLERAVVSGSIEKPESADASIQHVKHNSSRSNPLSIWHGVRCNQDVCQHTRTNGNSGFRFRPKGLPRSFIA